MTGKFRFLMITMALVAGMALAVEALAQNPGSEYDRQDPSLVAGGTGHCDHWYRNVVPGHRGRCDWYDDQDGVRCRWNDRHDADRDGGRNLDRDFDDSGLRHDAGCCW